MSRVKDYRLRARLTMADLARKAGIDSRTVAKAENGRPIREVQAVVITDALSEALGIELKLQDLDINIYR